MKVLDKSMSPNGKLYIGKALTGSINDFGSADSRLMARELTAEQRRDSTIRKAVLWESDTASDQEVSLKEVEFSRAFRSHDPRIGYNQWPKFKGST